MGRRKLRQKYRILKNKTCYESGRTLYRIQALKDFADVKKEDWVDLEP